MPEDERKDRKDRGDRLADAERHEAEESEADREFTTPRRAALADRPPGGEPGVPIDQRDEDPDWRAKAAGTDEPSDAPLELSGEPEHEGARNPRDEEAPRREADEGLSPRNDDGR